MGFPKTFHPLLDWTSNSLPPTCSKIHLPSSHLKLTNRQKFIFGAEKIEITDNGDQKKKKRMLGRVLIFR